MTTSPPRLPPPLPEQAGDGVLALGLRTWGWRRALLGVDRALPALTVAILLLGVPLAWACGAMDLAGVSQLGRYCCLAVMAIGLDLVWGYAGALSMCQALFFTLGGYCLGLHLCLRGPLDGEGIPRALFVVSSEVGGITLPWFWQPFDSLLFSLAMVVLVPGAAAFAFGWLAFRSRIRGVYFSIITQALTVAAWLLFCRNDLRLCGTNGLTNFTELLGCSLASPGTKLGLYLASAALLIGAAAFARWLVGTRFGRVLVAVRDSEARLRFAGWQPVWFKSAVFALAAVMAGLGGALYAPQTGIITPANMQAVESILVVVWVAVGGRGTVSGAVVGALGVNLLYSLLTTHLPRLWPFLLGGLFVGAVLFLPEGVVGLWRRLVARARPAGATP